MSAEAGGGAVATLKGLTRALLGRPEAPGPAAARGGEAAAEAREEGRAQRLFEHAPDAVMIVREGRYTYLNPAALRLFGADAPARLVGSPAIERLHPDDRAPVGERIESVLVHGKVAPLLQERYLRLDGAPVEVEVLGTPLADAGGAGVLVFARDISRLTRAEAEQAELRERLAQAQMLESVGRLAGGIAHDFNNHLSSILGYCEMVRDTLAEGDPRREQLAAAAAAGESAAELARRLLGFGKRQLLRLEPLDLNSLLTGMSRILASAVGEGVELALRTTVRLPLVMADPRRLEQAVLTLALNGRDAMAGGGRIVIETAAAALGAGDARLRDGLPPGTYVLLSVSDNGSGAARERREGFAEPVTGPGGAGPDPGFGMAAVAGIVRQHAAFLHADGAPGRGTTIAIGLPAIAAAAPARPETARGGDETILVVDDEEVLRQMAVEVLRSLGYTVLDAGGGEAALRLLDTLERPVDLLLTDVVMPEMNGPELARRFRGRCPRAGVLFMTGYAGAVWKPGHREEPGPVLPKPFTIARVAGAVRGALDAARRAAAAPGGPPG